jgi:hypothetical protein
MPPANEHQPGEGSKRITSARWILATSGPENQSNKGWLSMLGTHIKKNPGLNWCENGQN